MKKFLTIALIYLLPFCLLVYLLVHAFSSPKTNVYTKISQGQPISILVAGDSIGAGSGATKPEFNFANRLKTILQNKYSVSSSVVNVCMGGNTTYAPLIRVFKLKKEHSFDLVIICSGQNDQISTLGKYYEALIRNIKTKYPDAEIISILQSSQKSYTDIIQTIQKLAKHYNILTADTITPFTNGENGEYNTLTDDGIHPNNKGYAIYAKVLENLIATNVKKKHASHLPIIRKLPAPLFPDSLNHACFQAFPTNVLTRTENTFTGKLNFPKNSLLGMDVYNIRGMNSYKILINDTQIASRRINWEYDKKHFITELSKIDATGECQVSITFGTQNQADTFRGFFVTYPETISELNIAQLFSFLSASNILTISGIIRSIKKIISSALFFSILALIIKHIWRINKRKKLFSPLIEHALKLTKLLYFSIIENENIRQKKLKVKDIIAKYVYPSSYIADCTTCERALVQMELMYEEAKRIRNLERGLISDKNLEQVINIIEAYEKHLLNSFEQLKGFKDTQEKYKCDIHFDVKKNEISTNPYILLNTSMNSFVSSIDHLFFPNGIFGDISNKIIKQTDNYYWKMKHKCESCSCYCKPDNFRAKCENKKTYTEDNVN